MRILYKFIILTILVTTSLFSANIGKITLVKGDASINREGSDITVTLGAKLNEKDTITTKEKSKVQVIFNDKTIITIGRNSTFSINEYLFEDNKAPIARFGLLKGAVRTITGKIGKIAPNRFSIKTKTATIGIRGTIFSVLSNKDGSTEVFCTSGAIVVEVDDSLTTVPKGFYLIVSSSGEVSNVMKFTTTELNKMKKDSFINAEVTESFNLDNIVDTINEVDIKMKDTSKESIANEAATDSAKEAVDVAVDIDVGIH